MLEASHKRWSAHVARGAAISKLFVGVVITSTLLFVAWWANGLPVGDYTIDGLEGWWRLVPIIPFVPVWPLPGYFIGYRLFGSHVLDLGGRRAPEELGGARWATKREINRFATPPRWRRWV